ncbi:MAG: cell wall hydrolase, partial [Butyrivibrio sp.]|nr:cell wall hydrolase [Butyrivibrio sp.]
MKNKILLGTLIFILVWTSFPLCCIADEYDADLEQSKQTLSDLQRQVDEAKKAMDSLQGERNATQTNVNKLQNDKKGFLNQRNEYNNKLNDINDEISANEAEMDVVSEKIVKLSSELMEAKAQEDERYKNLKLRIKSTYENGGDRGALQLLLGAGSFHDFFTRFEYLNAVVSYDNKKVNEYKALQREIEAKTAEVKVEEDKLKAIQDKLDGKQNELVNLTASINGQIRTTDRSITSETGKLADFDKKLAEADKRLKELEAKAAAAQAELAKKLEERLKTKENLGGSYSASDYELIMLAATIQAEADGESYQGKLGVGSVIMNRVKSSAFPNSVEGVITQNMQFASWRSGKVQLFMDRGPNSMCIQAARAVLDGARIGDYLFFMTRYWADHYGIAEYQMIGNHAFFYRWVTKEKPPEEPKQTEQEQQPEQQPEQPQEAPAEEQHEDDNSDEEEN